MARITIKHKREKPILNQHPWIFSGAIAGYEGSMQPGDIVSIRAHDGQFLAQGYWNPDSQIEARLLSWENDPLDERWWRNMLQRAIDARANQTNTAYRLINAENDYLPGLIVDRYGDWLVMQSLTLGIEKRKHMIADILSVLLDIQGIYERSDVDVREKEGLSLHTGIIWGKEPPEEIIIQENGHKIAVDVYNGHKTGFYLDQAENRALVGSMANNKRVLNLFSYTGGFGVHALANGADYVVNVDASTEALELGEANLTLNNLPLERAEHIQADVFAYLREVQDQYDIVILDPPKFAHNKQQLESAARGYKDINLNAFNVVKPGGYLMTYSCSGALSADLFQKIVFGALADSGRQAQILQHLGAGEDHPVALTFPEGEYLKGLLLRVY